MPRRIPADLRQADQARTDFAVIESKLEFQLAGFRRGSDFFDTQSAHRLVHNGSFQHVRKWLFSSVFCRSGIWGASPAWEYRGRIGSDIVSIQAPQQQRISRPLLTENRIWMNWAILVQDAIRGRSRSPRLNSLWANRMMESRLMRNWVVAHLNPASRLLSDYGTGSREVSFMGRIE
jgi:hypothetical protein